MEPAQFSPETQALAGELAAVNQQIADKNAAGDQILETIVEQLQKFRDIPNEIAALHGRAEELKTQLSSKVTAELKSLAG